ncbi:hypothetical protein E2P81_ATG11304 [Venturia nashicola]|nr:hypothetical protein E2P81_ATG11304 [Venturia nashicola]
MGLWDYGTMDYGLWDSWGSRDDSEAMAQRGAIPGSPGEIQVQGTLAGHLDAPMHEPWTDGSADTQANTTPDGEKAFWKSVLRALPVPTLESQFAKGWTVATICPVVVVMSTAVRSTAMSIAVISTDTSIAFTPAGISISYPDPSPIQTHLLPRPISYPDPYPDPYPTRFLDLYYSLL